MLSVKKTMPRVHQYMCWIFCKLRLLLQPFSLLFSKDVFFIYLVAARCSMRGGREISDMKTDMFLDSEQSIVFFELYVCIAILLQIQSCAGPPIFAAVEVLMC